MGNNSFFSKIFSFFSKGSNSQKKTLGSNSQKKTFSKKELREIALNVTKLTISQLPSDSIKKGMKALSSGAIKIPMYSNDKDVMNFINEYELYKPENLIRFMIGSYQANFDGVSDMISTIYEIDAASNVGKISGAMKTYLDAMEMKEAGSRISSLADANSSLNEGISQLQEKIKLYIRKVEDIDKIPKYKKIIKSHSLLKQVDSYTPIARNLLKAWVEAAKIKFIIAQTPELGSNTQRVINDCDEFIRSLNLTLMADYSKDSEKSFWTGIRSSVINSLSEYQKNAPAIEQAIINHEENIDYENIEIF